MCYVVTTSWMLDSKYNTTYNRYVKSDDTQSIECYRKYELEYMLYGC